MSIASEFIKESDIVICSYMPDLKSENGPKIAGQRYAFHIAQLVSLNKSLPKLKTCLMASNWDSAMQGMYLEDQFNAHYTRFFDGRRYKAEIHNMVMSSIKRSKEPKAILILGDDVVPTKMEGIKLNPFNQLKKWIAKPETMPAPCLFFSCKGTLRDTYYKERMKKGVRFSPTAAVTDWAILVRNDFQVRMEEEEITHFVPDPPMMKGLDKTWQLNSDAMLRFKAASLGYEVLKDQELFFETFQSTSSDKNSVWYSTREARREGVEITDAKVAKLWPWLFENGKPIWMVKGRKLDTLHKLGFLRKTKYGYVPNPQALKAQFKKKQSQKNSLVDLL